MLPRTPERERSIESLQKRADEIRVEIYANLTPWQRVLVARHPNRPNTLDYVSGCSPASTNCTAIGGSPTITPSSAASATIDGKPVAVIGHQKGRDTKQKIFRNFGYARPEGYRKALRVMQLAEKFRPADRRVHRHAGGLPGHRVRGARRRRGHRRQPPRDEHARGPDRRHRVRRGRQRRRARDRDRRPGADAGVLGLQRDSARGMRGDPLARRRTARSRRPRR